MDRRIDKLWVNGVLTHPRCARLEVDPGGAGWRVVATLVGYSPFRRRYGLSAQLEDGRTVHGSAVLVGGVVGGASGGVVGRAVAEAVDEAVAEAGDERGLRGERDVGGEAPTDGDEVVFEGVEPLVGAWSPTL